MMKRTLLLAAVASTLSVSAHAEFPMGKVGINLAPMVDMEISDNSGSIDGDGNGWGLRGELAAETIFGYVETQFSRADLDNVDVDLDETRLGIGLRTGTDQARLIASLEHYDVEMDIESIGDADDDGIGVQVGGEFQLTPTVNAFASYGLLSLDDVDGDEFRLGASSKLNDTTEVYAAYRMLDLDGDTVDTELSDLRIGVNLLF